MSVSECHMVITSLINSMRKKTGLLTKKKIQEYSCKTA